MTGERGKRISDRVFKRVEKELYNYPTYKAQLRAYPVDRADILLRYREWFSGGGGAEGEPSDRTGDSVVQLRRLDAQRDWLETMVGHIEVGFALLDDAEQELVRLKYWSREKLTNEQIIATMQGTYGVSRRQWYRMRDEIVAVFARVIGLLVEEQSA